MLKNKLINFIAKRVAALLIVLAVADLVFLENKRWLVLAGLLAGSLIAIGRLGCNEWLLRNIFRPAGKKAPVGGIAAFTLNQLVLLAFIVLAFLMNIWVLYGFLAGVLAAPLVIMFNSITEAFGITKNNFE